MKRKISITLALMLLLSTMIVFGMQASAAEDPFVRVIDTNGNSAVYSSEEDLREVFKIDSSLVGNGYTIEVSGKVAIPFHTGPDAVGTARTRTGLSGTIRGYVWVLNYDNVTVRGIEDTDATLYFAGRMNSGMGFAQATIIVYGNNATFENLSMMAAFNGYYNAQGSLWDTLDVYGEDFTIRGCTMAKYDVAENNSDVPNRHGGVLCFSKAVGDIVIEDCVFDHSNLSFYIQPEEANFTVKENTFDGHWGYSMIGFDSSTQSSSALNGSFEIIGNTFQNFEADYKKAITMAVTGTLVLEDNIVDQDNDKTPDDSILDHMRVLKHAKVANDATMLDQASVIVTENGKKEEVKFSGTNGGAPVVEKVFLTGVKISRTNLLTLNRGTTYQFTAAPVPGNADDATAITWTSSDTNVAVVDAEGYVVAVGAGTATITANCGGFTSSCDVTVNVTLSQWFMDTITNFITSILQILLNFFTFQF